MHAWLTEMLNYGGQGARRSRRWRVTYALIYAGDDGEDDESVIDGVFEGDGGRRTRKRADVWAVVCTESRRHEPSDDSQ